MSVEDDDLAGFEDVSSGGEDDNYEAELTDREITSTGAASIRRPYRKRARVHTSGKPPLIEGKGRYFRVMGFNRSQRAAFVQTFMRFGVTKDGSGVFSKRLRLKSYDEIKDYGILFLKHINEEINYSPTFSDGVPKEGLRIEDVLVRWGMIKLFRGKVEAVAEGSILFTDDIISRYPGLKGGKIWKESHDWLLMQAVVKHGYGRWQAIVDDKDLKMQEVICQELNLHVINTPPRGCPAPQRSASVTSKAHFAKTSTAVGIDAGADVAQGVTNTTGRTQPSQDRSAQYHVREIQRRQVEFIKQRALLLEKGLTAELHKPDDELEEEEEEKEEEEEEEDIPNDEIRHNVTGVKHPCSEPLDTQTLSDASS